MFLKHSNMRKPIKVNFLHPHGPAPSFYYPVNQDIFENVVHVLCMYVCTGGRRDTWLTLYIVYRFNFL